MAGLGRKVFTAGDILAAADVQGYLQDQSVMVFAGTAARSSAIGTPSAGMLSFRTDGTVYEYYNGSSWVGLEDFSAVSVSAAYTAVAGIDNSSIVVTGTAAVTITIPDVLITGNSLNIIRDTSGTVTIAAGTGVTSWAGIGTAGTAVTFKIDQQYNGAQVIKTAANTYRVIGKIAV
jgi:hypothetical protein